MSKYFSISTGLRGAYLPDSAYVVKVDTRRELKSTVAFEADSYAEAGFVGASQRAVAWLAAEAWREARRPSQRFLSLCLPLAREKGSGYAFGIFIAPATRAEYLEQDQ